MNIDDMIQFIWDMVWTWDKWLLCMDGIAHRSVRPAPHWYLGSRRVPPCKKSATCWKPWRQWFRSLTIGNNGIWTEYDGISGRWCQETHLHHLPLSVRFIKRIQSRVLPKEPCRSLGWLCPQEMNMFLQQLYLLVTLVSMASLLSQFLW